MKGAGGEGTDVGGEPLSLRSDAWMPGPRGLVWLGKLGLFGIAWVLRALPLSRPRCGRFCHLRLLLPLRLTLRAGRMLRRSLLGQPGPRNG